MAASATKQDTVVLWYELRPDEVAAGIRGMNFRTAGFYAFTSVTTWVPILLIAGAVAATGHAVNVGLAIAIAVLSWAVVAFAILGVAGRMTPTSPYAGALTVTFSDAGVSVRTARGQSQDRWEAIRASCELRTVYVLRRSLVKTYIIIPKRALAEADPDTEHIVRQMLRTHARTKLRADQ
jgi:hypothetical protein